MLGPGTELLGSITQKLYPHTVTLVTQQSTQKVMMPLLAALFYVVYDRFRFSFHQFLIYFPLQFDDILNRLKR